MPVTNQWKKSGHFYPIQIAQYGLSQYSKWLKELSIPKRFKNFTINQKDRFLNAKINGEFIDKLSDGFKFKFFGKFLIKIALI